MSALSDRAAQLNSLPAEERRGRLMLNSCWVSGAILVIGIVLSAAGFRFAHSFYQSEARLQLERHAMQRGAILSQTISRYGDSVRAMDGLFTASGDVKRQEFATFAESMLRRFPAIEALEWIPRVRSSERSKVENAAQRDGLTNFRITEFGEGRKMTPAGTRDEYFPIYFVEPFAHNRRAAGFDLATNPTLFAALNEARDSGKAVATQRIRLVREARTQSGFLLIVPTYQSGRTIDTVAQRRAALRGFSLGVFRIGDMIANALRSTAPATGLEAYVFDLSAPEPERLLAFVPSPLNNRNPLPLTEQALRDARALTVSHDIGGRIWNFVFSPMPGHFSGRSNVPIIILGIGLTLSMSIALAALFGYNRVQITERLIDQRTVELRQMTQDLTQINTALLKSEIQTEEAKLRLMDALEVSPSGLVLFDKDDQLVMFNSMAEQISSHPGQKLKPGMAYSEYARLHLEKQFPKASKDEINKKLAAEIKQHRELIEGGSPTNVEGKIGPNLWIRRAHNRTAEGGSIGILTDITDLKQSQVSLELQTEELKRSNEELEQFAYLASHDMQEPLRVIASFCDLLQLRYADKLDDDGKEFISYAVDGARRMRSLLDDLLTYSRIGRSEIKISPVSLGEVMEEVESRLGEFIKDEKADLKFDDLPTVRGDQTLLTQLLQNLVGNGIKFHGDTPPKVEVTAEQGNDGWTIAVSDNGIGIEAEYADRVFQMFQRLHGVDEYAGNGLGLALCRRAVERHGGKIWIEPTDGPGTTIKFTLPV